MTNNNSLLRKVKLIITLLGFDFKTNRKRIIQSTIGYSILIIILVSLFSFWFSYRITFYDNYITSNSDWKTDSLVSVESSTRFSDTTNVSASYFNDFQREFLGYYSFFNPSLVCKDISTTALGLQLYFQTNYYELMAIDDNSYNLLDKCLYSGRLPGKKGEILYYPIHKLTHTHSLNETISLYGQETSSYPPQNLTIVGIIDHNISQIFPRNGKSIDIFQWTSSYDIFPQFEREELFLTNPSYLLEILNSYPYYQGIISYLVDINYNHYFIDLSSIQKQINNLPTGISLPYSDFVENFVYYGKDLRLTLVSFLDLWLNESKKIAFIGIPIFFLIGIIAIFTAQIGSKNITKLSSILIKQGYTKKLINTLLFFETLVLIVTSFLSSYFIGLLLGSLYPSQFSLGYLYGVLLNPFVFLSVLIFSITFLLIIFYSKKNSVKAEIEKNTNLINDESKSFQLFSYQEVKILLIILVVIIIAMLGVLSYIFSGADYSSPLYTYSFVFWQLISLTGALSLYFIFLLLTRIIKIFWKFIDKFLWKRIKNSFTLSIKQMVKDHDVYRNIILAIFITGLLLFPGIVLSYSIENHLKTESKLESGYVDLYIENWVIAAEEESLMRDKIENLSGVIHTSKISQIFITFYDEEMGFSNDFFFAIFLKIENITKYLQTIDDSLYTELGISNTTISTLSMNDSVLVDFFYAKKRALAINQTFTSEGFTKPTNITDLKLVNTFEAFPLIPLQMAKSFSKNTGVSNIFSIVANNQTINNLVDIIVPEADVSQDDFLLIKTDVTSNITSIKESIQNLGFTVKNYSEVFTQLEKTVNRYSEFMSIFGTILMIFSIVFIGGLSAQELYQKRMIIIETFYRIGSKRSYLKRLFSLELLWSISLPLFISFGLFIPLLPLLTNYLFQIQEQFIYFQLWLPWWLIIIGGIIMMFLALVSWYVSITIHINRYEPVKEE